MRYRIPFSPIYLIYIFSAILIYFYCINNAIVFDDLYWPINFNHSLLSYGWAEAFLRVLLSSDFHAEFRSNPFSRALQFLIWSVFGQTSVIYPIFISFSQAITALFIYKILKRHHYDDLISTLIASCWIFSPYAISWTFHFYSYLVLPFQLLILFYFLSYYLVDKNLQLIFGIFFGLILALTGEIQLPVVLFVLLLLYYSPKGYKKFPLSATISFISSLLFYYIYWLFYVKNKSQIQRFNIMDFVNGDLLVSNFKGVIFGIGRSLIFQTNEILSYTTLFSTTIFFFISKIIFILLTKNKSVSNNKNKKSLILLLTIIFLLSVTVLILLSVFTSQVSYISPRRYLFVPFTLLLIIFLVTSNLFINLFFKSKIIKCFGNSILFTLIFILFFNYMAIGIASIRSIDRNIVSQINSLKTQSGIQKSLMYFVSNDFKYINGLDTMSMSGLNMSDSARQELFESPFGAYWTSKIFIQQILGFTNVFNPYADIGALDANSKIIANTSLNQDFNPQDIKIFASSLEFQPHFYLKRISKNIFIDNRNDVLINLGNKNTYFERPIYRDKNFIDPPLSINNLIRNYGFLSGDDALYESNLIGSNLVGYKFNRNGSFIYQIDFFKPSDVQISFDFWEQWNHKVGERVFNLDISWDGESWSRVGEIDPTLINVHSPFSVIVQKKSVSKFLFRISKTASSVDIPFINSIRISELGQ